MTNLKRCGEIRISVNSGASDSSWSPLNASDGKKTERTTFVYVERPKSHTYPISTDSQKT